MDFLAFLVQKSWPNFRKFIRGIPSNFLGDYYKISGRLAITLAPETPGSRSRALKIHITAWNPTKVWATISAHCPGDDVMKEKTKIAQSWRHPSKTPNPNLKQTRFLFGRLSLWGLTCEVSRFAFCQVSQPMSGTFDMCFHAGWRWCSRRYVTTSWWVQVCYGAHGYV